MEALIVVIAALAALTVINVVYSIAITLARWSPVIAIGVLAGWVAHGCGCTPLDAFGIGLVASTIARHMPLTTRAQPERKALKASRAT